MHKRFYTALAAAAVLALGGWLTWRLTVSPSVLPAPALAVQRTLELRSSRSKDASAYAEHIADPEIARALASDSAAATRSPIPDWQRPYVSAGSSSSAEVVVVWKDAKAYPDWPYADVFRLTRSGGAWRIIDASSAATADGLPKPAR